MKRLGHTQINGLFKRAIGGFLSVALILSLLVSPLPASGASRSDTAQSRLIAGLFASASAVDLRDLSLSPAELGHLYTLVLEDTPALFYVAPRFSYAYREGANGAVVETVYPLYTMAGELLTEARAFYRRTVTSLLAEVDAVFEGHPHTEAEIVLFLHDLLAARYDYDTRPAGEAGTTAYRLFADGTGVCQAYAMAALELFRAAGLTADLVTSPEMDHAWVHVRADGSWYHVDITRDDPIPTEEERANGLTFVTHTRLLCSDAGLVRMGYRGFSCTADHQSGPTMSSGRHACADARYETVDGRSVFGIFEAALIPISVGIGRPLVWMGSHADGMPQGVTFTDHGAILHTPGDVDGDGCVTAGDLLHLEDPSLPDEWRDLVRQKIVSPDLADNP